MIKKKQNFKISAKYYDKFYQKKKYTKETNFVSKFFPKNKKKLKILDLGMGTGSHLINLIKKGHKVDGVELSLEMINLAKQKIDNEKILKNYKFYNDDVLNFRGKKNHYDVILSLFHVVNYLKNFNSLKTFFLNIHKTINKSGVLLFDCWNDQIVKNEKLKNTKKTIIINNYKIIRNGKVTKRHSRIKVSYTFKIFKNNKLLKVFNENHNLYSFSKSQVLKASKNKFTLINNCTWFNKKKSPSDVDFSSLFIFKKKSNNNVI